MNEMNRLRFILHVSDFHLNDNEDDLKHAKNALNVLTNELKSKRIKIDYLIHTGDIIDSSDLYEKTASLLSFCDQFWVDETTDSGETIKVFDVNRFKKEADYQNILDFDNKLEELTQKRFDSAIKVMRSFIVDLNLSFGNVVICSGNHDVLRLLSANENEVKCKKHNENNWQYTFPEKYKRIYKPFKKFLNKLGVANKSYNNELVSYCSLNNLNFLILNTNSLNPGDQKNGYYCVNCEAVKASIEKLSKNDFAETLNIVLAHKPIYEICEKARLSYKRYLNTPFMNNLKKYIGDKGIYLCGDKHTRSIVRSYIHDIPHYISGEPLKRLENDAIFEVEYNLLEISDCSIGMERKIHIRNNETNWNCDIRPQDAVISKIYNYCKSHIVNNTFEMISDSKTISDWDDLYQELLSFGADKLKLWYTNINTLFLSVCKYRKQGCFDIPLNDKNIFSFVLETINNQMKNIDTNNILNVRGEYSSGKSTFLGLLYIFLMYKYSVGAIDFIPAYFNIESNEVLQRISYNGSYHKAVKFAFDDFVKNVQEVADKEHHSVCYIIDGIDEQDCWSYKTENSVGRGLLDVLSNYANAKYILSFSQHRLPCFKNTMPERKYNDKSDIIYFNPVDVREKNDGDNRFFSFVEAFLKLNLLKPSTDQTGIFDNQDETTENVCDRIRSFKRLTITLGFMYQNYKYIIGKEFGNSNDLYKYYIDRQYEICLNKLKYGFVNYAPEMAYLFSYKGYTYEKFMHMKMDEVNVGDHIKNRITENANKIFETFLFIKKNRDAREYLIALHYNRELQYYAEHTDEQIKCDSILNQFIIRDIAVIVRKLWGDTNKYIIVCELLLKRNNLSNCLQSMLIYCLVHLNIYAPIRDKLLDEIYKFAETTLSAQGLLDDKGNENEESAYVKWDVTGKDNMQKLEVFLNLNLKYTMIVLGKVLESNSSELVKSIIPNREFQRYIRQHQMLYYGDLSVCGEEKKRSLNPEKDIIYKGFDFHNCYNYLYFKLSLNRQYPLREFDLYTMCSLISTRLANKYISKPTKKDDKPDTFFYRLESHDKAVKVLEQAIAILSEYINQEKKSECRKCFQTFIARFKKELKTRKEKIDLE